MTSRINAKEAIELQKEMRKDVRIEPVRRPIRTIAGADVSLERFGDELYAGIIVLSYPDLKPVEHAVAKMKVEFPYIPGLLSFREIPGLIRCLEKLSAKPDLIIVDGQGIAHPRRLGIAAHLGIVSGVPTIGCAKSRLYGVFEAPKNVGDATPVTDPKTSELIGYALKSKARSNPLIISPGYKADVEDALSIVRETVRGYKLPEPTRKAHELVNRFRRGEIRE
ncbi:MAG TPA: deoxyribonuclease V [Candidatus Paceibacterota bacterium]|nr:deoxyribonuclease V [Candidatus Paceibacterota bacterium]